MDNYEPPTSGIHGQITVAGTDGEVYRDNFSGGVGVVRYENMNYENPKPIDVNIKYDGKYRHEKSMFAEPYKIYPRGEGSPFVFEGDTANVTLSSGEVRELNFEVTPYLRIEDIRAENSTVYYTVTRPDGIRRDVQEVAVMYNTWDIVEPGTCNEQRGNLVKIPADNSILGNEQSYTFSGLESGKKYYFRVVARAAPQWNFSPIVEVTIE